MAERQRLVALEREPPSAASVTHGGASKPKRSPTAPSPSDKAFVEPPTLLCVCVALGVCLPITHRKSLSDAPSHNPDDPT